jgi:hypothetical protein
MNELQAEKLRDIITKIIYESGEQPQVTSFTDDFSSIKVSISFRLTKEGNLK